MQKTILVAAVFTVLAGLSLLLLKGEIKCRFPVANTSGVVEDLTSSGKAMVDGKEFSFSFTKFGEPVAIMTCNVEALAPTPVNTIVTYFNKRWHASIDEMCKLFSDPELQRQDIEEEMNGLGKTLSEYQQWDIKRFSVLEVVGTVKHGGITAVVFKVILKEGSVHYQSLCVRRHGKNYLIDESAKANSLLFRSLSADGYSLFHERSTNGQE